MTFDILEFSPRLFHLSLSLAFGEWMDERTNGSIASVHAKENRLKYF